MKGPQVGKEAAATASGFDLGFKVDAFSRVLL